MKLKVTYIGGTSDRTWKTPDDAPNGKVVLVEHKATDDCTYREMKWGPFTFPLDKPVVIDSDEAPRGKKELWEQIINKLAGGGNRFFKVEKIEDVEKRGPGRPPKVEAAA